MNQKLFFNRIKGYREEIQVAIFHELEELFLSSFQRLEEKTNVVDELVEKFHFVHQPKQPKRILPAIFLFSINTFSGWFL